MENENEQSEGDYLSELLESMDPEPFRQTDIENLLSCYTLAKAGAAGARVHCPMCKKVFAKKTKSQGFCSNKGPANCKDAYWNTVDPIRADRAHAYAH